MYGTWWINSKWLATISYLLFLFALVLVVFFSVQRGNSMVHAQFVATTTVSLTICGDGIVAPTEVCDDGINTGHYAFSIATRNCNSTCSGWGDYCGDGIVKPSEGEECDDGNNTAGDYCSPTCQNEIDPVTEGGGGGDGGSGGGGGRSSGGNDGIPDASVEGGIEYIGETNLNINGRAYPGATITVLHDGEVERVVEADSSANFSFSLNDQTPGILTLGFWALDKAGRRSVTYAATFQVVQNAVTTLSGILIPPTLAVNPEKAPHGTTISFTGSAFPSSKVQAYLNDEDEPEETLASNSGEWAIAYDSTQLTNESFHTVKANYIDERNPQLKSGFSLINNFYIGTRDVNADVTADLNNDGAVNLTDFSILLFNWNTSNPQADINKDGIVSLPDFSILLFYWTG